MSAAVWFWLFYVFGALLQVWVAWPAPNQPGVVTFRHGGYGVVLLVLLFLLGFRVFGSPIQ